MKQFTVLSFLVAAIMLSNVWPWHEPPVYPSWLNAVAAGRAFAADKPDIQWFKDTMRIAPKYQEKRGDILGMSWAHFIFMVFLTLFFIGVLVAAYVRNKRTKELLTALLKEDDHAHQR